MELSPRSPAQPLNLGSEDNIDQLLLQLQTESSAAVDFHSRAGRLQQACVPLSSVSPAPAALQLTYSSQSARSEQPSAPAPAAAVGAQPAPPLVASVSSSTAGSRIGTENQPGLVTMVDLFKAFHSYMFQPMTGSRTPMSGVWTHIPYVLFRSVFSVPDGALGCRQAHDIISKPYQGSNWTFKSGLIQKNHVEQFLPGLLSVVSELTCDDLLGAFQGERPKRAPLVAKPDAVPTRFLELAPLTVVQREAWKKYLRLASKQEALDLITAVKQSYAVKRKSDDPIGGSESSDAVEQAQGSLASSSSTFSAPETPALKRVSHPVSASTSSGHLPPLQFVPLTPMPQLPAPLPSAALPFSRLRIGNRWIEGPVYDCSVDPHPQTGLPETVRLVSELPCGLTATNYSTSELKVGIEAAAAPGTSHRLLLVYKLQFAHIGTVGAVGRQLPDSAPGVLQFDVPHLAMVDGLTVAGKRQTFLLDLKKGENLLTITYKVLLPSQFVEPVVTVSE